MKRLYEIIIHPNQLSCDIDIEPINPYKILKCVKKFEAIDKDIILILLFYKCIIPHQSPTAKM